VELDFGAIVRFGRFGVGEFGVFALAHRDVLWYIEELECWGVWALGSYRAGALGRGTWSVGALVYRGDDAFGH
jgi:hypothetical protein